MIYSLGADPEFFIESNGKLKAIIGLLGGTKQQPKYLDDNGSFSVQEDNVAAEYNIPPSYTKEQFINNILYPQQAIASILGTDKFTINKQASAVFPDVELTHPQAKEFGCDPDYDAWNMSINKKPVCSNANFRTCGGHVHIGLPTKNQDVEVVINTIKTMDKYLGVWSVIADQDTERKKLYGKAGCFRPQPHGCEYRTLSNFWIFSKELIGEVWDRTQAACNNLQEFSKKEATLIQSIINNGDRDGARSYLLSHGL